MKRTLRRVFVVWCIAVLVSLGHPASWSHAEGPTVFQVSTFDALKRGLYDGQITFGELKKHGDFGMGTVNGLDGEMVAVDGVFYQVRSDGKAAPIPDSAITPFAVVTFFRAQQTLTLQKVPDAGELHKALDKLITCKDKVCVFRIDGVFNKMKVRSVPRQEKPYPPLETALKHQTFFDLSHVRGSVVGFRFPQYMDGVNFAGYHFHFITADRQAGGHVLDCDAEGQIVQVMSLDDFSMKLLKDGGEVSSRETPPKPCPCSRRRR